MVKSNAFMVARLLPNDFFQNIGKFEAMAKNTMIEQLCTAEQVLISLMVIREPVDSRFHIVVTTGVNGITMTLSKNDYFPSITNNALVSSSIISDRHVMIFVLKINFELMFKL